MAYAQKVPSPKGAYWLARYLDGTRTADGKPRYATLKDDDGRTIRYTGKRDARKAADGAEADVRAGRRKPEEPTDPGVLTLRQWSSEWYAALELAPTTMANYKDHLVHYILPRFQDETLRPELTILPPAVDGWEKQLRADGHAESSIGTYRATLRTCLASAAESGVIPYNPAASVKRHGRRGVARAAAAAARSEKVITGILGGLLVAERLAILTGRDDEFVLGLTLQHGLLRLGEAIGLEAACVTPGNIRVEWQLSEIRGNDLLIKAIPKFGSRGDVTVPWFLSDLLAWHTARVAPQECDCHGFAYVFRGAPGAKGRRTPGRSVTIRDVATAAGVTPQAVWGVLGQSERFAPAVRARVREAARDLGWVTGAAPADSAWHWRHTGVEFRVTAAASGVFPARGEKSPPRAVPLRGEWPGEFIAGTHGSRRAEWCWTPLARGLTPHSLRHSGRTWMEEQRVHDIFAEAQLRHDARGIEVYRHVTEQMRADYRGLLDTAWLEALRRRGEMSGTSPVRVVAALLAEASKGRADAFLARNPQESRVVSIRGRR